MYRCTCVTTVTTQVGESIPAIAACNDVYTISVISLSGLEIEIEVVASSYGSGEEGASGHLIVNGDVTRTWDGDTLEEVAEFGETLINSIINMCGQCIGVM